MDGFVEALTVCTDRHRITCCNSENFGEAAKLEAQRLHALSDLQETWTSTCLLAVKDSEIAEAVESAGHT